MRCIGERKRERERGREGGRRLIERDEKGGRLEETRVKAKDGELLQREGEKNSQNCD